MDEIIQLDENTRIAHIDALNWTVQELRHEPKGDRWRQANGDGFGPFCHTPAEAAVWLLEHRYGDSGFNGDLKLAIAEYRHIADDLKHAVERAVCHG